MAELSAIVLAAGQSTRMGGPNKLLLDVDGEPLVRRAVRRVAEAGWAEVVVVVGHEAERVRAALAGLDVRVVLNADHAEGQVTSVRAGLAALSGEAEGIAIALADQPALTADDHRELQRAFVGRAGGEAVVPTFAGRRGNPILLSRRAIEAILARGGRFGCRRFLDDHPDLAVAHPMASDRVLRDVDRPEDYATLLADVPR